MVLPDAAGVCGGRGALAGSSGCGDAAAGAAAGSPVSAGAEAPPRGAAEAAAEPSTMGPAGDGVSPLDTGLLPGLFVAVRDTAR